MCFTSSQMMRCIASLLFLQVIHHLAWPALGSLLASYLPRCNGSGSGSHDHGILSALATLSPAWVLFVEFPGSFKYPLGLSSLGESASRNFQVRSDAADGVENNLQRQANRAWKCFCGES